MTCNHIVDEVRVLLGLYEKSERTPTDAVACVNAIALATHTCELCAVSPQSDSEEKIVRAAPRVARGAALSPSEDLVEGLLIEFSEYESQIENELAIRDQIIEQQYSLIEQLQPPEE